MALREILIDDLDQTEGDDVATREFSIDGVVYAIDLNEENHTKLWTALQPFINVSRRKKAAARVRPSSTPRPAPARREKLADIREWAKRRNLKVSDRGRIPRDIVDLFEAESGKASAKKAAKKTPAKKAGARKALSKA